MKSTDVINQALEGWKLKIAIISAIVFPTVSATGAYYSIRTEMGLREQAVVAKINQLELETQKEYAEKSSVSEIQRDVRQVRDDVIEIKALLKHRFSK